MAERIEYSRIQTTLNAINKTIDDLMAQNAQNRVAVCGYGANATVLMPLAHYRHKEDASGNVIPYLEVGGMETLYHPSDLVYKTETDGVGWYWMNNRDTCYTVVVNAGNEKSTYTGPLGSEDGQNSWQKIETAYTVSNNVRSEGVKAFPGVADPKNAADSSNSENQEASKTIYNACSNGNAGNYAATQQNLIDAMRNTKQLQADDYVGYFTNTQGGIYLAYKQLADAVDTTYSENLTTGVRSTVARIPAAIIMSDGGANFAFNEMGSDGVEYSVANWNNRYGQKRNGSDAPKVPDFSDPRGFEKWYMNDNTWEERGPFGQPKDLLHRLGNINETGNVGDEWYKVYLPGNDTLKSENAGGDWDGLHGLY